MSLQGYDMDNLVVTGEKNKGQATHSVAMQGKFVLFNEIWKESYQA